VSREITLTTGARRLFFLIRGGISGEISDAECRSWLNLSYAADADLKRTMATAESIVFVIDDDPSFRRSTEMLIGSAGLSVQTFSSAEEFLRSRRPDAPACLLLDVRLPHLSGLDLQAFKSRSSLAERAYPKLVYYNKLDKGGHFAAWEQPELFSSELRAAFQSLR
jgi:PleD family two-component response regulator